MITRDQLRDVNKLVAEYEHPGTLPQRRAIIRDGLRLIYGVQVDDMERTSG